MEGSKTLRDYMLEGEAKNKAFISDKGEVYIVKNFRLSQTQVQVAIIDADLINPSNPRKRIGLPLGGEHYHLYDRKATFSDIKEARSKYITRS